MAGRVQVVSPLGESGSVPAEQLEAAVAKGYRPLKMAEAAAPTKTLGDRVSDFGAGRVAEGLGAVRGLGEMFGVATDAKITGDADTIDDASELVTGERSTFGADARDLISTAKEEHPFESTYGSVGGAGLGIFLGGKGASPVMAAEELAGHAAGTPVLAGAKALGVEGSGVAKGAQWLATQAAKGEVGLDIIKAVDSANDQAVKDGDISIDKTLSAVRAGLGYGAIGGIVLGLAGHGAGSLVESLFSGYGKAADAGAKFANKAYTRAAERETGIAGTPSVVIGDAMAEEGVKLDATITPEKHAKVVQNLSKRVATTLDDQYGKMAADAEGLGVTPSAADLSDMVAKRAAELSEISPAARRRSGRIASAVAEFEEGTGLAAARANTAALEEELAVEKLTHGELRAKEREPIEIDAKEDEVLSRTEMRPGTDEEGVWESKRNSYHVARVFEERQAQRIAREASEERQLELVAKLTEAQEAERAVRYGPADHASLREKIAAEDPELLTQMLESYHDELKDIAKQLGPDAKGAFLKAEHEKTALDHWRTNVGETAPSTGQSFDPLFGTRPKGIGAAVGGPIGGAAAHAVGVPAWVGWRGGQYLGNAGERALRGGEVGVGSASLKKIAVWAEAQRRTVELDAAVGTAVKGFFANKSQGSFSAPVIFDGFGAERDKKVQRFADEVSSMVANASVMAAHTQKSVGGLDEHSATQSMVAQQRIAQNVQALHARLPKQSYQTNYPFGGSLAARYSDQDVWALERYLAVAQDPFVALQAMRHNALSQEHVDALNETHPDVAAEILKASLHHGREVNDMQKLTQMQKLLGAPVCPEQEETTITGVQGTYMADRNKAQEGAQGNGSPSKPGSVSKSSATPASRLEAVQK